MTTLVPILGDQLSLALSSLSDANPADAVILMMEVADETTYVRHHRRKLAYILSAMRHHAEALRAAGWTVDYVALDDPGNSGSFNGEIARALARHGADRIVVTQAGEWRVRRCWRRGPLCSASPSRSAPTPASSPATPCSKPGLRAAASW